MARHPRLPPIASASRRGLMTVEQHRLLEVGTPASGTVTCPALATHVGGAYLTISDGTHEVKFEPRAKAQTSMTLVALATATDNQQITFAVGSGDPTVFELRKSAGFVASGGGVEVIDAHEATTDAQYMAAVRSAVNVAALEFTQAVASGLTALLTADATGAGAIVAAGDLLDSQTSVSAGCGEAVPVTGAAEVDLTGMPSGEDGAAKLAEVINAVGSGLTVTATPQGAVVHLENDEPGNIGNVAISQTGGTAFTVTGMEHGIDSIRSRAEAMCALAARADDILELLS